MTDNYQLWGGRYNPIIPVNNGIISPNYAELLPGFDPDIIYYSGEIGEERAKEICRKLNPKELVQLDGAGRNNFPGVYSHHLLPTAHRQATNLLKPFSLVYFNRHEDDPQASFYNLSFGITNQYLDDVEHTNGFQKTVLDVTNISRTNLHIAQNRPFFNCLLSQQQADFTFLKPTNDWEFSNFELIVYDENNATEDLIYFWNRALSQRPRGEILQLIASQSQLNLLITDPNFGLLLRSISYSNPIYLHSATLSNEEFNRCTAQLREAYPNINFSWYTALSFPRIQQTELYPYRREIKKTKSVLLGKKEFLNMPISSFSGQRPISKGTYAYDVEFFHEAGNRVNYLKFPTGTPLFYVLGTADSRVNRWHHASLFLTPEISGMDIQVPTSASIFNIRLQYRTSFGEQISLPVRRLKPSDAGLKLASFVKLFEGSLDDCHSILFERFWVDLILGNSTGKTRKTFNFKRVVTTENGEVQENFAIKVGVSNIYNHDGTFNYLDLKAELKLIYLEHVKGIREWLGLEGLQLDDDGLLKFIDKSIEEDFSDNLDYDLQDLVDRDALFIGMKVKCRHCGSNEWYSLAGLNHKMACKGCLGQIVPGIKSHLYYKFNDIIYNNLTSDPVKRTKQFNGNYIVLRTLAYYSQRHGAYESFAWAPSMDIGIKSGDHWHGTDIDIAMISNGTLIIGEAKASASDFNAKQFEQLKLMADAIQPDKLILACQEGNINPERIDDLKAHVSSYGCQVMVHRVEEADYFLGRIK